MYDGEKEDQKRYRKYRVEFILLNIDKMLSEYASYFSEEEINIIQTSKNNINNWQENLDENFQKIKQEEDLLTEFNSRIWYNECKKGNIVLFQNRPIYIDNLKNKKMISTSIMYLNSNNEKIHNNTYRGEYGDVYLIKENEKIVVGGNHDLSSSHLDDWHTGECFSEYGTNAYIWQGNASKICTPIVAAEQYHGARGTTEVILSYDKHPNEHDGCAYSGEFYDFCCCLKDYDIDKGLYKIHFNKSNKNKHIHDNKEIEDLVRYGKYSEEELKLAKLIYEKVKDKSFVRIDKNILNELKKCNQQIPIYAKQLLSTNFVEEIFENKNKFKLENQIIKGLVCSSFKDKRNVSELVNKFGWFNREENKSIMNYFEFHGAIEMYEEEKFKNNYDKSNILMKLIKKGKYRQLTQNLELEDEFSKRMRQFYKQSVEEGKSFKEAELFFTNELEEYENIKNVSEIHLIGLSSHLNENERGEFQLQNKFYDLMSKFVNIPGVYDKFNENRKEFINLEVQYNNIGTNYDKLEDKEKTKKLMEIYEKSLKCFQDYKYKNEISNAILNSALVSKGSEPVCIEQFELEKYNKKDNSEFEMLLENKIQHKINDHNSKINMIINDFVSDQTVDKKTKAKDDSMEGEYCK